MEPYQSYMLPGNHLLDPRSFIDSASDRRSLCDDEGVESNFMIGMSAGGGTRLRTMIGILGAPARDVVVRWSVLDARSPSADRHRFGGSGPSSGGPKGTIRPAYTDQAPAVHHRVLRGVREQAI